MTKRKGRRSRGGRPRKTGDRYPSGELKRNYGPTPELEAKRQQIVGEGKNPNMSTNKLDTLYERGRITLAEHTVLSEYGGWYRLVCGPGTAKAINLTGESPIVRPPDDEKLARIEERFRAAAAVLLKVSREAKNDVDNLVVFDKFPKLTLGASNAHVARRRDDSVPFYAGVKALVEWRQREGGKAAA